LGFPKFITRNQIEFMDENSRINDSQYSQYSECFNPEYSNFNGNNANATYYGNNNYDATNENRTNTENSQKNTNIIINSEKSHDNHHHQIQIHSQIHGHSQQKNQMNDIKPPAYHVEKIDFDSNSEKERNSIGFQSNKLIIQKE